MKSFIEVTDFAGGFKVLCAVGKIINIVSDGGGSVFIEMNCDKSGESSGILVCESYEEIKSKLHYSEV